MSLITKIEIQKNNNERVNIYVDNEYAFACDTELVYKFNLKNGMILDRGYIENIAEDDNFIKAKNCAMNTIDRGLKTEKEIYDKLNGKGYEDNIIYKVIQVLKEYDFINDRKYVQAYIKEKINSYGSNKIIYNLNLKGIRKELIVEELNDVGSHGFDDAAFKIAEKKYNSILKQESDERKIKEKLSRFLLSKGYNWETVSKIVKRLLNDDETEY
jgi:Uncharacterized protein conserved in bacteria